ncbi:putative zinc ribbon domain protein [Oxobacter pfennigii]|uniref:Putative zinc ribbon domain protein n=1 Tax=Oxobacter pfennigii TaxID=36849 RepID=A0A0P9AFE7_9CLOT|nr:C4-type zinc ribbon domain-containing protein [Oxobacter pfennigii]KPU44083.1 putative zinc ribbon domain protein [Oxobacter pfennigii]
MFKLELLWALQNIDGEIVKYKRIQKNKETLIKLNDLKSQYGKLKESLQNDMVYKKDIVSQSEAFNLKLKTLDKRVKGDSEKLYNEASSIKVIENLQNEIEINKKEIDKIENQLLGIIEKDEKVTSEIKDKKENLIKLKKEFEELKEEYNKIIESGKEILERLEGKRAELLNEIDKGLLARYDEITAKKGSAISKVEKETCSQCGVKLNAILYDKLKKNDDINLCDHCGRILYI